MLFLRRGASHTCRLPTHFLTPWLKPVRGFIGLRDVRFVAADRLAAEGEQAIAEAEQRIERLAA